MKRSGGVARHYLERAQRYQAQESFATRCRRYSETSTSARSWMRLAVIFFGSRKLSTISKSYMGGDIVPVLVERNTALFGKAGRSFITLDIASDPLPSADLWLCRDCFIHLDYAHIFKALENLARSDIKYFVASNYPTLRKNKDTFVGGFRPLNLLLPPFNLPRPMTTIEDGNDGDARNLSLWQTDALRPSISHSTSSRFPRLGR